MSEQDDKTFMTRFSLIIAGLAVFAVLIIFFAMGLHDQLEGSGNPMQEVARVDRIEPVFGVYTGDTGRAAAQAAAEQDAADEAEAEPQLAFDGSTDGEMIYNNVCQACHMAGAAGAPQLVADQWTDRLAKGEDTLVEHAINGIGVMPAKGGRSDLSDEQVRASVEYMLAQIE